VFAEWLLCTPREREARAGSPLTFVPAAIAGIVAWGVCVARLLFAWFHGEALGFDVELAAALAAVLPLGLARWIGRERPRQGPGGTPMAPIARIKIPSRSTERAWKRPARATAVPYHRSGSHETRPAH
jgi:hypothetical protein